MTRETVSLVADPPAFLRDLFAAAVKDAQPLHKLAAFLPAPPDPALGRTVVIGAGKAAGAMAQAVEALWDAHCLRHGMAGAPLSGLVVTRYGHVPPRPAGLPQRIAVAEAAHPVPDEAGQRAAETMLSLLQGPDGAPLLTEHDLVLCLVSGGGSALLALPADGLTLADKQRVNQQLLASGADIGQMNTVRKHLSRIKGGRLAQACHPARLVTLLISDVPGDDPSVIASGPTVPDPSSCSEALDILDRYRIDIPDAVRRALADGRLETPKPGDAVFARAQSHLVATPMQALQAAAAAARQAGMTAHILSDEIEGESCEVGKVHAALARAVAQDKGPFARPCVLISGGETTVTVQALPPGVPPGRGGRSGEFCLGLAQALQGQSGVWALAADTDGIDGVQDNAGAQVSPDTLARARAEGLSIADHVWRHDAYAFFAALNDLVITGPTHTNVNDFRAVLVI